MADRSKIEWTSASWNPIRGCSRVSEGCRNCYAERITARFSGEEVSRRQRVAPWGAGLATMTKAGPRWTGEVRFVPELLDRPLRWRKPRRIFVNSMSDLFHEKVEDEWIDRIFSVMAMAPQHVFQTLTKRPERMQAYLSDPYVPTRIARAMDAMRVASESGSEEIRPIPGYPGYFASSHGVIFSEKRGRRRALRPDVGDQGHMRIQLHRDGSGKRGERLLVHRLILETFVGPALDGVQGCHRDGNPKNNALANLRWGTQADNWEDRRRHGTFRAYSKLTSEQAGEIRHRFEEGAWTRDLAHQYGISETQVHNIVCGRQWVTVGLTWPLPNVWAGVSVEDQATADARIPWLLKTPAAVRWVSYEPALGPVDFTKVKFGHRYPNAQREDWRESVLESHVFALDEGDWELPALDWLVVGGESGPGARPFDVAWARSAIAQAKAAGVPVFVKQLGAKPTSDQRTTVVADEWIRLKLLRDRKGGNPQEWPADLRIREYPA